jgi:transcriptional regulator with XRE-family HTH domain
MLCELSKLNQISPTAVVTTLGFSKGNLARWRNGTSPTGEVLSRFADYFNVSTDYLLGRTDEPAVNRKDDNP